MSTKTAQSAYRQANDTDQCSDTLAEQSDHAVIPGQPLQLDLFANVAEEDDTEEFCRAAKAL